MLKYLFSVKTIAIVVGRSAARPIYIDVVSHAPPDWCQILSTALAKNHAKPANGDTSSVKKINNFQFS